MMVLENGLCVILQLIIKYAMIPSKVYNINLNYPMSGKHIMTLKNVVP